MPNLDLVVVIPVYNEEKIIEKVINDWLYELSRLKISFELRLYNDGSKDNTGNVLDQIFNKLQNKNLKIIHKENSGHGPTILQGYRGVQAEWIFQVDSDDEFSSQDFAQFWEQRFFYDFLIGVRDGKSRPLARKIISLVTRLTVSLFYGGCIKDINIPYRLMRKSFFESYFQLIPASLFAPNVVISGIATAKGARIFQAPVAFQERSTGEVSIKKWKLIKSAIKSFVETISFRVNI